VSKGATEATTSICTNSHTGLCRLSAIALTCRVSTHATTIVALLRGTRGGGGGRGAALDVNTKLGHLKNAGNAQRDIAPEANRWFGLPNTTTKLLYQAGNLSTHYFANEYGVDSLAKEAQMAANSASSSGSGRAAGASTSGAAGTEAEALGVLPTAAALEPAATGTDAAAGVAAASELHGLCSSKLSCAREVSVKAATKNTQGLLGASCDHCVPLEGSAVDLPTKEMFVYYLVAMVVCLLSRAFPTS
jgi:hypothetical protein